MRKLATALAIIAGVFATACEPVEEPNPASTGQAKSWTRGYKPCKTEDSKGPCYWDARKHGNGKGRSFTVTKDGRVIYRNSK